MCISIVSSDLERIFSLKLRVTWQIYTFPVTTHSPVMLHKHGIPTAHHWGWCKHNLWARNEHLRAQTLACAWVQWQERELIFGHFWESWEFQTSASSTPSARSTLASTSTTTFCTSIIKSSTKSFSWSTTSTILSTSSPSTSYTRWFSICIKKVT